MSLTLNRLSQGDQNLRRGLLARLVHQIGRPPGRNGWPNLPEPRQWEFASPSMWYGGA